MNCRIKGHNSDIKGADYCRHEKENKTPMICSTYTVPNLHTSKKLVIIHMNHLVMFVLGFKNQDLGFEI